MLVFLLYRFRVNLNESIRFRKPLYWSEVGKNCFASQPLLHLGLAYVSLIHVLLSGQMQIWMEHSNILLYPFDAFLQIGSVLPFAIPVLWFYVVPVISACLVYRKLIKPLNEEKTPGSKWFRLTEILAISPIIALVSWTVDWKLRSPNIYVGNMWIVFGLVPQLLPFSMLIAGVIAVEISCHKLRKQTW